MNLNQLDYFVEAVRLGNFSAVARLKSVTPQTVSKSIAALEEELGLLLFERGARGKRRMRPTAFALSLLPCAYDIVQSASDLHELAHGHPLSSGLEGTLSVMVEYSPCRGNGLRICDVEGFRRFCPHVDLTATLGPRQACLEALEAGSVDAALMVGRIDRPGFSCVKISSCPVSVALARSNPLAARRCIRLEDLRNALIAAPDMPPISRGLLSAGFLDRGIRPNFVPVAPNIDDHLSFMRELNGAVLVLDDPALGELFPATVRLPLVSANFKAVPLCLVHMREAGKAALSGLERYLLGIGSARRAAQSARTPPASGPRDFPVLME